MKLRSVVVIAVCLSSSMSFAQKKSDSLSKDQKIIQAFATRKGCSPTLNQLLQIQNVADRLLAKCLDDTSVCKDSENAVHEVNKVILDLDSMKYVFGKSTDGKASRESIVYALNSIGQSGCFSKTLEKEAQYTSIIANGNQFIFSAAIACNDHLPYFKIDGSVYKASAPLTNKTYDDSAEYAKYLNDNLGRDRWDTSVVPYVITDEPGELHAYADPTSDIITTRLGYTKKGNKIIPDDFKGFRNLVISASMCIYKKNNDGNHADDNQYEYPVFSDYFALPVSESVK